MASRGEKIIVLTLLVTEVVVTGKSLRKGSVPRPSQYIASLVAFAVIGGLAAVGPSMADMAAALSVVVLLTTLLQPEGSKSLLGILSTAANPGTGRKSSSNSDGEWDPGRSVTDIWADSPWNPERSSSK